MSEEPEKLKIHKNDNIKIEGHAPIISIYADFAERWYKDTQIEAKKVDDENAIRREIVFAACFLESYIFEWARGLVDIQKLDFL